MDTERTHHLVANEPFLYDGRMLEIGERFSAIPEHAMILEGLCKATADPSAASPAPTIVAAAIDEIEDDNSPEDNIDADETIDASTSSDEQAARNERNRKRRERRERRPLNVSKAAD